MASTIQAFSRALYDVIPENATIERVLTGFRFTEGPVWHHQQNLLIFSDIIGSTTYSWDLSHTVSVVRRPTNKANGLTLDRQGRLLSCEHVGRRVSRMEWPGTVEPTTVVDRYQGMRLNSPNDIVVRADGRIYFTDPPSGLFPISGNTEEMGARGEQETPWAGVYSTDENGQNLVLEVQDFPKPNGLAFSPDERRLYIDDTIKQHVRVFDVTPDGRLTASQVFAELDTNQGPGVADGLKVDQEGHLYVTGPGGIWIWDANGNALGLLRVPEVPANLVFGGADRKTMFITARTSIYRTTVLVEGI